MLLPILVNRGGAMVFDERWGAVAVDLLMKYGGSWKFWAFAACVGLLAVLWRAKRFRFLIEYNARD